MNVFSRKTNISAQLFKLVWLILVAQLICTAIPRLAGNELPINTDRVQAVPWHFDSAGRQVINYHNAIHICPLIFFVDESFLMLSDSFSSCSLYLHRSLWMYLSSRPFFFVLSVLWFNIFPLHIRRRQLSLAVVLLFQLLSLYLHRSCCIYQHNLFLVPFQGRPGPIGSAGPKGERGKKVVNSP